jgi:radical SAM superfamily enzyme YgiQ (UPF0313 family)
MKNVYLANFSMTINPGNHKFLPYSVAGLWSYAEQDEQVKKNYQLAGLYYEKKSIDEIVDELVDPFIFGFSVYIWNENYSNEMAEKIKKRWPKCMIIYGGPQVPQDSKHEWWDGHKYVDVVVFQEGEEIFKNILLNPSKEYIDTQPNTAVNFGTHWKNNVAGNKRKTRQRDLSKLPSPYLSGNMPNIKSHHAMLFETNRGCPYACSFCDWGGLTYSKLVNHDINRLEAEIEYAGKNKIGFLYSVDANFGILKDRDNAIADMIIATKKKYGYPKTFFVNWAKNANEEILKIAKKMYDAGLIKSFIMSLQTLTPLALELIKRDNMDSNDYQYFAKRCAELGLPFDCELIVGNPGETIDTWKDTYLEITNYQELTTYLYPLALLPNAELGSTESRKEFGFKTIRKPFPGVLNEETKENIELVVATKWLSEDDLKHIWEWTWTTRTGHEFNFLRDAADYMARENIVSKKKFYNDWHTFVITSDGLIKKHFDKAKGRIDDHIFGLASQSLGYRENLTEKRSEFYAEARTFLEQYTIDKNILTELINYCDARLFDYDADYPITRTFNYDFIHDVKRETTIRFTPTLNGATTTTAHLLLEGSDRVSDNFKIRQTLTCTLNDPEIIL